MNPAAMIGGNGTLFSPLEQDAPSPDTSDHSTDEGKPYTDSSATSKSSSRSDTKPQQPKSEINKVATTILKIEASSESISNSVNLIASSRASSTNGSDPPSIFKEFVDTKITVSQLKQNFPELSINEIINECQAISEPKESWISKCLIYSILWDPSAEVIHSFNEKSQQEYLLRGLPENLRRIVSDIEPKWSKHDIETIHALSVYDLTAESILESLPTHKLEDTINVIAYDFEVITWTTPEIKLLESRDYIATSNLVQFLPYRSEEQIAAARRKIAEAGFSEYSDINSTFHVPLIRKCVANDLTRAVIEDSFPFSTTNEIIERFQEFLLPVDLTAGEKRSLKDYIKSDSSVEIVMYNFPCRSREFVTAKYKEMKYLSSRKTKFKSDADRLLYEAKWVVFTNGDSQSGRRSRKRSSLDQSLEILEKEASQIPKRKPKVELTPEQKAERASRNLQRKQRLAEQLEERRTLFKTKQAEREQRRAEGLVRVRPRYNISDLLAGSEHFQSVIGDKRKVEQGQKRKRVKTEYFHALAEEKKLHLKARPRQVHKNQLKKALKMEEKKKEIKKQIAKAKKPGRKPKSKTIKKESRELEDDTEEGSATPAYLKEELENQLDEEEDDYVSPFDPTDINSDTPVPLNGRELFEAGFYGSINRIQKLNYVNHQDSEEHSKMCMTNIDDKILLDDDLAVHIIKNHRKNYKSLPISFPVLEEDQSEGTEEDSGLGLFKSRNIVRVRFLIHPQHCESFILAAPKSNELDPIYEIVKLFMIHYTLYFSHSAALKSIITDDYCEALEKSVEENDFSEFMFVIDKWNSLMIHLSPNEEEVGLIKSSSGVDINSEVREFLAPEEIKIPTVDDLKLNIFYEEIMLEDLSPSFQIVKSKDVQIEPRTKGNEIISDKILKNIVNTIGTTSDGVEVPSSVSESFNNLRPKEYFSAFFSRLQEKKTISRFTMQQILLRVYSRVVSTDSRKLRSYKAFTAEVYGELLPSFTSEVLEKVNLLPYQKFYDLGSGVGNTTFQAALEFGASVSGGCELMDHASKLTKLQQGLLSKHLSVLGLKQPVLDFALSQSFVSNDVVRKSVLDCDVLIINNYLFDVNLNSDVGRLLYGLRPGTKIISLRNFIRPRYRATGDTIFDKLKVEMHEMSDFLSVSWTASKVPYYISTVQENILPEYLGKDESPDYSTSTASLSPMKFESDSEGGSPLTPIPYETEYP